MLPCRTMAFRRFGVASGSGCRGVASRCAFCRSLTSDRIFKRVARKPCLHLTGAGASISTSLWSSMPEDPPRAAAVRVFDLVTRPGP